MDIKRRKICAATNLLILKFVLGLSIVLLLIGAVYWRELRLRNELHRLQDPGTMMRDAAEDIDGRTTSMLIGTWTNNPDRQADHGPLVLRRDGTFSMAGVNGKWYLENSSLMILQAPNGGADSFTVHEDDKGSIVLIESGTTYVKVEDR